jgi:hypothetical protein
MAETVKKNFKLSPPWITYWRQLEALFNEDPDIEVGQLYDTDDKKEIWIYVSNEKKFRALNNLLPKYHTFGNVKVKNVIKLKGAADHDDFQDLKDLFEGNPRVAEIKEAVDFAGVPHIFINFNPEVIQFPNDDTSDYYGLYTGLTEDIAREVFEMEYNGAHFSTAPIRKEENVNKPLGEWP